MSFVNLQEFIQEVLDIAQDYAVKNECKITYGKANQVAVDYKKEELSYSEGMLYYISSQAKRSLILHFYHDAVVREFRVVIDNGGISLTLNQNLGRNTTFPSNDFNRLIDDINGDFKERFLSCLYMMQDWEYALKLFYTHFQVAAE